MRFGFEQRLEAKLGMTANAEVDNADPEARHRVVVLALAAVSRSEMPDRLRNGVDRSVESHPLHRHPGEA